MILNKKGLAVLPLVALLFTSCGQKNIGFDAAVKFAEENYTATEPITPTKGARDAKGDASNDEIRKELKEEYHLDDNLQLHEDITDLEPIVPITADDIKLYEKQKDLAEFYLNGKNLTIKIESKMSIGTEEGVFRTTTTYNEKGYLLKTELFESGKTTAGSMSITTSLTYTY